MATTLLPQDFKDFLRLLQSENVNYLIVGGYAVAYYGYPRATGDLDIWVAVDSGTSSAIVRVLRQFGFSPESVPLDFQLQQRQVIRMGVPPLRIEVLTGASGVNFDECYSRRTVGVVDELKLNFISLDDLKINKRAAGRTKDQNDLEHLP